MKKNISFNAVVLVSMLLFFQSCTLFRFAYSPTIQNVPGFTEKNESRITAVIASPLSGTETNFTFQGAYAVTNHFALTAGINGTVRSQDELTYTDGSGISQTDIVKYKRNSFDFGAGIFYPVSADKKVFIEAYAGYAFGSNKITDISNNVIGNYHNSDINRFYLQPMLSIHPSGSSSISTSLRFTSIGYTNIKTTYSSGDLSSYYLVDIASRRLTFIEPALVFSIGSKSAPWIRLQGQINFTFLAGDAQVYYRSNYFGLGIQFDPVKAIQSSKH
ncbi:MAG: hypothetical protein ABL872_02270 [Lacibacter sp.]